MHSYLSLACRDLELIKVPTISSTPSTLASWGCFFHTKESPCIALLRRATRRWWDAKQKTQSSYSIWPHFYQMPKAWSTWQPCRLWWLWGQLCGYSYVSHSRSCPLTYPRGSYKLSGKLKPNHDPETLLSFSSPGNSHNTGNMALSIHQ